MTTLVYCNGIVYSDRKTTEFEGYFDKTSINTKDDVIKQIRANLDNIFADPLYKGDVECISYNEFSFEQVKKFDLLTLEDSERFCKDGKFFPMPENFTIEDEKIRGIMVSGILNFYPILYGLAEKNSISEIERLINKVFAVDIDYISNKFGKEPIEAFLSMAFEAVFVGEKTLFYFGPTEINQDGNRFTMGVVKYDRSEFTSKGLTLGSGAFSIAAPEPEDFANDPLGVITKVRLDTYTDAIVIEDFYKMAAEADPMTSKDFVAIPV